MAKRAKWTRNLLLLPSAIGLAVCLSVPIVRAFGLAFHDEDNNWMPDSWRTGIHLSPPPT